MSALKPLILVLEDDEASAEALILILTDWGADVVHAANADRVSAAVGARLPDIRYIIADYNLGSGPDGVTLVKRLRQFAPSVRILVLSGAFQGSTLDEALSLGLDVMSKPAKADAIVAWLERS